MTSRPRTILHLIDTPGPGGAEQVCAQLARGLDPARFRSIPVVVARGWLYDDLAAHGLEPRLIPQRWRRFDLPSLREILQLMRAEGVELVQTHLAGSAVLGSVAGRWLGVPVVSTFHGAVDLSASDRWGSAKAALIRAGSRRVVFVSRALRDTLRPLLKLDAAVTEVIYNGVDAAAYGSATRNAVRAELGVDGDDFVLGALGNLRASKSYEVLVAATARIAERLPSLKVVIAGDAPAEARARLEQQAREAGVLDRVRFLGFRADAARVLSALDAFALTSRTEGFSIATLEAMATGLPVVVTRSGGPEEIVTDGVDGLLVPVQDPEAVAGAVLRVATDATLRARLALAARATVAARFSGAAMVTAYEALYDELLRSPARR